MTQIKTLSRSGWLLAGLLAALIVVPSAAAAATVGVTELAGANGQRAAVTRAGQLTTAEAAPGSYQTRLAGANATAGSRSACVTYPAISASKAFIVREFTVNVTGIAGTLGSVVFYEGANCQPRLGFDQVSVTTPGLTVLPVDPGIALPRGGKVSVSVGGISALVAVFGYTVPARDVSSYTKNGS
jgi:hypothetical protein